MKADERKRLRELAAEMRRIVAPMVGDALDDALDEVERLERIEAAACAFVDKQSDLNDHDFACEQFGALANALDGK